MSSSFRRELQGHVGHMDRKDSRARWQQALHRQLAEGRRSTGRDAGGLAAVVRNPQRYLAHLDRVGQPGASGGPSPAASRGSAPANLDRGWRSPRRVSLADAGFFSPSASEAPSTLAPPSPEKRNPLAEALRSAEGRAELKALFDSLDANGCLLYTSPSPRDS